MTPRDIALSYLDSFATGDADTIAAHVSADFENIQSGELGKGCTGRDVYRGRLAGFLSTFQNLRYEPEKVIADGDQVAVVYRMRAEDDGKPFDIPGVMIITVAEGKIISRSDHWDSLSYLKQTGKSV